MRWSALLVPGWLVGLDVGQYLCPRFQVARLFWKVVNATNVSGGDATWMTGRIVRLCGWLKTDIG